MKLELKINNQQKTFKTDFISARKFRKLLEYDERMNYNNLSVEEVDELVGFTCEVFENQFTFDEFYDGLPSNELIPTISKVFVEIRTGGKKTGSESGNGTGEQ